MVAIRGPDPIESVPRGLSTMTRTATLTFGDQTIELPVIEGTEGELALDISALRARTGLITLDPGFGNTGPARAPSPSSTARRASSATAASRSSSSPSTRASSRPPGS